MRDLQIKREERKAARAIKATVVLTDTDLLEAFSYSFRMIATSIHSHDFFDCWVTERIPNEEYPTIDSDTHSIFPERSEIKTKGIIEFVKNLRKTESSDGIALHKKSLRNFSQMLDKALETDSHHSFSAKEIYFKIFLIPHWHGIEIELARFFARAPNTKKFLRENMHSILALALIWNNTTPEVKRSRLYPPVIKTGEDGRPIATPGDATASAASTPSPRLARERVHSITEAENDLTADTPIPTENPDTQETARTETSAASGTGAAPPASIMSALLSSSTTSFTAAPRMDSGDGTPLIRPKPAPPPSTLSIRTGSGEIIIVQRRTPGSASPFTGFRAFANPAASVMAAAAPAASSDSAAPRFR